MKWSCRTFVADGEIPNEGAICYGILHIVG